MNLDESSLTVLVREIVGVLPVEGVIIVGGGGGGGRSVVLDLDLGAFEAES